VAREFDGYIRDLLAARRSKGDAAPDDITTRLMRDASMGRQLEEEEIVSILRNWTVGELGTIAASVGILVHALAVSPSIQARLQNTRDFTLDPDLPARRAVYPGSGFSRLNVVFEKT
jgi:cytochrome P450